ncbi:MAG: hypothetical protein AB7S92_18645 [Parvibaculaceae bacterium]
MTLRNNRGIWVIPGSDDARPPAKLAGACRSRADFFIEEKFAGVFPNGKIRRNSRKHKVLADLDIELRRTRGTMDEQVRDEIPCSLSWMRLTC